MPQRTILLIQDRPADAKIVREALRRSNVSSFQVEWVRLFSDGLERLANVGKLGKAEIAAVLVELLLPDSRGIETFERLYRAAPHIPILILTGSRDEGIAKLAVQRGAQDYLLKSQLDSYVLPKALGSMIDRAANTGTVFADKEQAQITLNSIGDAVISIDGTGHIAYINEVAERLTGWSKQEATGRPLAEVCHIIDDATRLAIENPMALAIQGNKTVRLTPNCVLIRRDGVEAAIEDSAAPIHDRQGKVTGAVMVFHDVSAARALAQRMAYLAQHDSLSELPNRLLLNDRLTQAISLGYRHQKKVALLFLDLDRFKHINDSLGHAMGDRVLQLVAKRLLACVRTSDTVSRQGGDEFVVLLSELSHSQDAATCADKVLLALGIPLRIDEYELHVTASIGIATYPDDGTDAATLLKHADVAMYDAKEAGRSNYQFFKPAMNARAVERQCIEDALRHALDRGEFMLHYQPKMHLQTGKVVGVEALIRWHHPVLGIVSPTRFIPIAEECGLIVPIGRWVLREACRQAHAWLEAGLPLMQIAINTSSVELRAKDFVAGVQAIIAETGLNPGCLEFELTERFLLQDQRLTETVLKAIKGLGIRLALDDFGTGYSSLTHLSSYPIDTLKIDRSFVNDLATNSGDSSIVSAVIKMGESLDISVVAEGIETTEQYAFLQKHRCPFGQGYLFSPPVGAVEVAGLLGRTMERHAIAAA